MAELMQASRQWASRPDDERFTSLLEMKAAANLCYDRSQEHTVAVRDLELVAGEKNALTLVHKKKGPLGEPTNWGFQQLTVLGDAAASSMRTRPAAMVADWVNYGLKQHQRDSKAKVLTRAMHNLEQVDGFSDTPEVAALTSAKYGRVWDLEVIDELISRFGDGVSGTWKVPGEFGHAVPITKDNTTLYWSDRSMFVFLANESNRIQIKNRRNGKTGSMARGFFLWNSETGAETLGFKTFYFDYVCSNRIVWGAEGVKTIKIRHSKTAPERFLSEVQPALIEYSNQSAKKEEATIAAAQKWLIEDMTNRPVDAFLSQRFGPRMVDKLKVQHVREEGVAIESLWDVVTSATAYAKSIKHQDVRIDLETKAGALLDLVAEHVN